MYLQLLQKRPDDWKYPDLIVSMIFNYPYLFSFYEAILKNTCIALKLIKHVIYYNDKYLNIQNK